MKEVPNDINCPVGPNDDVYITIAAGDGQSVASYFQKPDLDPVNGDVEHVFLGKGSALKGKTIPISSMVTQVNTGTVWASLTYTFTSIPQVENTVKDTIDAGDNSIRFRTKIHFL